MVFLEIVYEFLAKLTPVMSRVRVCVCLSLPCILSIISPLCHHRNPDRTGAASPTVTSASGEWMADLHYLWTGWYQNGLIAYLPSQHQTTPPLPHPPNKRRKRRVWTRATHRGLEGVPSLKGTLCSHQNIPASDTKLTRNLDIDCISPPLVMDKLVPVNSREITSSLTMSLLLEVKCTPAIIITKRLTLVTHTDHLSRNKMLD